MKINCLDHGYTRLIECWGQGEAGCENGEWPESISDKECGIIEAARMSTQGAFRGWDQDSKLLKYLYENGHSTPFEFAGMTLEVQAPIFVFREWMRHRTFSYSEMSARYSPLPDLYYVPTLERVMAQAGGNKQAAGVAGTTLTEAAAAHFLESLGKGYEAAEEEYQYALSTGVPKELARCIMPVGHYSRMRVSGNLRNWLGFLRLRLDPAAQYEIREFAKAVAQIVAEKFPKTWALFEAGRT